MNNLKFIKYLLGLYLFILYSCSPRIQGAKYSPCMIIGKSSTVERKSDAEFKTRGIELGDMEDDILIYINNKENIGDSIKFFGYINESSINLNGKFIKKPQSQTSIYLVDSYFDKMGVRCFRILKDVGVSDENGNFTTIVSKKLLKKSSLRYLMFYFSDKKNVVFLELKFKCSADYKNLW